MGDVLVSMYNEAEQIGSLLGRVRLAMLTKVPSTKAAELPDSPELVATFTKALAQLRAQCGKPKA